LKAKGQKQGDLKGPVTQKGREGMIEVIAVSHEVVSPRDPASGLPTGKRMHKPLTLTWQVDIETPMFYNSLTSNENIPEFRLIFFRPEGTGVEQHYYTIELVNASVASIAFKLANNKMPELTKLAPYVDVSFTYQKITWKTEKPSILGQDDWETPLA